LRTGLTWGANRSEEVKGKKLEKSRLVTCGKWEILEGVEGTDRVEKLGPRCIDEVFLKQRFSLSFRERKKKRGALGGYWPGKKKSIKF